MSSIVVIGAQWGDEGKGKLIDVFSEKADFVVRTHGGANAGHTLVLGEQKVILHLMPSGVLHDKVKNVIAAGVVLDPHGLIEEIDQLKGIGHFQNDEQLLISESATLLLSVHKALDKARESGQNKLGTTGRGIGPAYEDRASRRAITFGDLYRPEHLRSKLELLLKEKNFLLEGFYNQPAIQIDELLKGLSYAAERLAPYRCRDVSMVIHKAQKTGKKILFEGAQGALLDQLHGTYPYVTSSFTIAATACTGVGLAPQSIQRVMAITKAYTTRVGEGPFPTELQGEIAERLQKLGGEIGSTTGRTRRCGWLDLVALRYAVRLNGVTHLALTKLDVFSGMEKIAVCTGYKYGVEILKDVPPATLDFSKVEPIYNWLPGWKENISGAKSTKDLPPHARDYVQYIGNELATPVDVISVGPSREQTLWVKPLF